MKCYYEIDNKCTMYLVNGHYTKCNPGRDCVDRGNLK